MSTEQNDSTIIFLLQAESLNARLFTDIHVYVYIFTIDSI